MTFATSCESVCGYHIPMLAMPGDDPRAFPGVMTRRLNIRGRGCALRQNVMTTKDSVPKLTVKAG